MFVIVIKFVAHMHFICQWQPHRLSVIWITGNFPMSNSEVQDIFDNFPEDALASCSSKIMAQSCQIIAVPSLHP